VKLRTAGYLLSEGVRAVRRHPALSASAIVSMAASLLVLALFLLIGVNVRRVMGGLEARKNVVVYLKTEATDEDRQRVEERLKEVPGVGGVRYVSAEEAWQEFTARMDAGAVDTVGENPLRLVRACARGRPSRLSRIQALANEIGGWTGWRGLCKPGIISTSSPAAPLVQPLVGLVVGLAVIAVVAQHRSRSGQERRFTS
jgi:cell division protein FtsX